jgi:hypothetical protein
MAAIDRRLFGPTSLTTTPTTAFTAAASTSAVLTTVTFSSPAATAANTARISIGADATGTRAIEIPIPAGPQTTIIYPNLVLAAAELFQISVQAGTGIIATGDGYINQI